MKLWKLALFVWVAIVVIAVSLYASHAVAPEDSTFLRQVEAFIGVMGANMLNPLLVFDSSVSLPSSLVVAQLIGAFYTIGLVVYGIARFLRRGQPQVELDNAESS